MNSWICSCCFGCFAGDPHHIIKCKVGTSSMELKWCYCDKCLEDIIVPIIEGKNIGSD